MIISIKHSESNAGLPLSKALLKFIKSEIGDTIEVQIIDRGLIIKPISSSCNGLSELLATCTKNNTRIDENDIAWLKEIPVARER